MAKNKKQEARTEIKKEKQPSKIGSFIGNETSQFVVGVCIFMLAAYSFLAFLSFFFTGDADQSKLENLSFLELSSVKSEITNWAGHYGAFLSNLFINKGVGVSAFMICIFLFAAGIKLMKVREVRLGSVFILTQICMIWISLFLGFFFVSGYEDSFIYLGGYNGYYTTELLKANVGWFGTFLIILATLIITLAITYRPSIHTIRTILAVHIPAFVRFFIPSRKPKTQQTTEQEPTLHDDYVSEAAVDSAFEKANSEIAPENTMVESIIPKDQVEVTTVIVEQEQETPEEEDEYVLAKKDESEDETPWRSNKTSMQKLQIPTPPVVVVEAEEKETEFSISKPTGRDQELVKQQAIENYDPTLELSNYKSPSYNLLNQYNGIEKEIDMEEQNANKKRIEDTLRNYGIEIQAITATVGPTVTLYEIIPKQGVRIAKIRNLEDDIALSLAALGIRIIAPIPGKGTVGIEVPNKDPQIVSMHSIIASRKFQSSQYELPLALGKTITNDIFMIDLVKMPHILVAGATGQGKSVGLNAIITSLLYKKHPSQLKLVLIDPKKVEFNIFSKIEKHFLAKLPNEEEAIITDVTKVVATLNSVCKEMDERYDLLKAAATRNIKEYNAKFITRKLNPEKGHRYMPYIVVIVDEFGDLIMTAGKEIELPIARIAQLARAVGIHMIIATQRPSTNIITGMIKANFPARIAFKVSSMIDSRTILDSPGANQLIGKGDLLFSQGSEMTRVQCAFVDTPEVEKVSEDIGDQMGYPTAFLLPECEVESNDLSDVDLKDRDQLFEDAARLVVINQQGSTSMIQRKFSIGYNRAGRIMDQLEAAGIVGPYEGSKARQVLIMDDIHLEQTLGSLVN